MIMSIYLRWYEYEVDIYSIQKLLNDLLVWLRRFNPPVAPKV